MAVSVATADIGHTIRNAPGLDWMLLMDVFGCLCMMMRTGGCDDGIGCCWLRVGFGGSGWHNWMLFGATGCCCGSMGCCWMLFGVMGRYWVQFGLLLDGVSADAC